MAVTVEGRFAIIPEALLMDPRLSSHAVRVYGVLIRFGTTPDDCFPTYQRIAEAMGASARSVPAWVRELEAAGWVLRRLSAEGEPNGYTVRTHRQGPRNAPSPRPPTRPGPRQQAREGRANERGRAALADAGGPRQGARRKRAIEREPTTRANNESPCSPRSAPPSLFPVPSPPATPSYASGGHDVAFEAFWAAYPRKVGKIGARKAWGAAIRKAPDSAIIRAAAAYGADPNREPEFTCHPTTWLNQGRWEDDPLPMRSNRMTKFERSAHDLARSGPTGVAALYAGQVQFGSGDPEPEPQEHRLEPTSADERRPAGIAPDAPRSPSPGLQGPGVSRSAPGRAQGLTGPHRAQIGGAS